MAAFNFPNSPSTNDLHTENNVTWKWNGTVWKRINNSYLTASTLDVSGIGTFGGSVSIADKIIHTGDTNTALRFPAADTITAETNGSERVRIDSSGDVKFWGTTTNNSTNKNVNLTAPSWNTGEEDVNLVQVENEQSFNQISFGGGTSGLNAATTLRFLTASAVNTTAGTERLRIDSSGRVGINESSPQSLLDIHDSTSANDTPEIRIESFRPIIRFADRSGSHADSEICGDDGIKFRISTESDNDTALTERVRIDSSGRVLIGTTTVGAASYGDTLTIASSTSAGMTIRSGTSNYSSIYFADGTSGDDRKRGLIEYYHASANNMRFYTNAAERLRITSDGKLGLGETSPDFKFHSKETGGSTIAGLFETNQSDAFISFQASGTTASSTVRIGAVGDDFLAYINGGYRLRIDSNGHMGLGVTPSAWATNGDFRGLQVGTGAALFGRGSGDEDRGGISVNYYHTGSAEKYIGNGHAARIYLADGNIDFSNASANSSGANAAMTLNHRLRITSDGKIGINATSPVGYLHVQAPTDDNPAIILYRTSGGGDVGSLAWRTSQGTNAYINWRGGGTAKGMQFYTSTNGNDGTTVERFRINANSNGSTIGSFGTGTTHYNQCSTPDRSSFKIGGRLHVDGAFGHNAMCGLYYNCYSGGNDLFYGGSYAPSGGDGRASAVVMRYGGVAIYTDHSSTAYSSQQQITTMSERLSVASNGDSYFCTSSGALYAASSGKGMHYRNTSGTLQVCAERNQGWSTVYLNKSDVHDGSDVRWIDFWWGGSQKGNITFNSPNSVSYNTTSDYRLKKDDVVITNGISRVKQLRPITFKWKENNASDEGFFAHEVQSVVPGAVSGTKDQVVTQAEFDANSQPESKSVGDAIHQQMDSSKLVPLLTAALKEAIAKIEILETKVAALESS